MSKLIQTYNPQFIHQLQNLNVSKGEYFKHYPHAFDYALPQPWLDGFNTFCKHRRPNVTYAIISSTTIWAYPPEHSTFGIPVTCCKEVYDAYLISYPIKEEAKS